MKKNISIIIGVVFMMVLISVYTTTRNEPHSGKLVITASFYTLGHFVEQVGRDAVIVKTITPLGVEAHDYEPSPRDIIEITNSNIFIYNGGGFDPWAEKLAPSLKSTGVRTVNMSEDLAILEPVLTNTNPHFWLDPVIALSEIKIINKVLSEKNSKESKYFKTNTDTYNEKLLALDREYMEGLKSCALEDMIVSHKAFEYLGTRYTIKVHSIAGISPDEEPSPKELGSLAVLAREKGIKYIFFEPALSSKLAMTVANEVGAETLVLNPIETITKEEQKEGEDYISIMKKNLNNLKKALKCM